MSSHILAPLNTYKHTVNLAPEDLEALRDAVQKLEHPSLAINIANVIGSPIEKAVALLPDKSRAVIQDATRRAIERCLDIALSTLDSRDPQPPSNRFHKAVCWASGAVGGSFGLLALAAELPVSTAIMLRSIGDIARSLGENLSEPESRLACLAVFALGGSRASDDSAETGYYAVRAALAQSLRQAAAFVAERGFAEKSAPPLVRFVSTIAARFGITVSEKAAAQALPVIGAVTGSTINWIFMEHFQNIAHGHFTIRRLERKYGAEAVRAEYERERQN
jgi:hypothetical protein